MINNPLFRKFKENSLWWVLIAVFLLMLGVVTVDTEIGITPTVKVIAFEAGNYEIKIIEKGGDFYILVLDEAERPVDGGSFKINKDKLPNPTRESIQGYLNKNEDVFKKALEKRGVDVESVDFRVLDEKDAVIEFPETYTIDLNLPEFRGTSNRRLANDPNRHEASHGINAMSRKQERGLANPRAGTGIHLGFDNKQQAVMTWIEEPEGSIKGLRNRGVIPAFFRSPPYEGRYKTYIIDANISGWDIITYLFDEWGAYNIGGQYRLNQLRNGQNIIVSNITDGPADFIVIGGAVALYLKDADPNYFNSKQFKLFLKFQIERSMGIINGVGDLKKTDHTRRMLDMLKKDPSAKAIRDLLVDLYGKDWTNKILDF